MRATKPVWEELHGQLQGIAKRRAALDAEEAACLVRAEAIRIWLRLGYVHMGEYMERELGYGPRAGMDRLRIARALVALPLTAEAMRNGLAYSAVRELVRVMTTATEEAWLERVRGRSLREVEQAVSGHRPGDMPDDPPDPALRKQVVRLELAAHVAATLHQAATAIRRELGHEADDDAVYDALARRALAGGDSAGPAHQIAYTVCKDCKRGWQVSGSHDVAVSAAAIERAACDAELVDADTPAKTTRTVSSRVRKQVLARDRHRCTVPGCRTSANVDVHHIVRRADGGSHKPFNLTAMCSGHHAQLHEGKLTMTGTAPDAIEFRWTTSSLDPAGDTLVEADVRKGLVDLGFTRAEAAAAVTAARAHVGDRPSAEVYLREALKQCPRGRP